MVGEGQDTKEVIATIAKVCGQTGSGTGSENIHLCIHTQAL